ncbi:hypothetical protein ROZALSC1DRAFT_28607 [Rozella allomycis CSF55]|uniref:Uncharacterized protein n=1 Tax=Rozella allomycis (strain CSF55) TaxID=988480 RepID=A0A075ASE9_ROZAC|nr:hypothetical protein O9G_000105 [Rozella allomycis CSF55]RKP19835.1 hypothetical protein ROZALSC1DRAFT_28607 [Rozella allomycis CSF55]|eukprot:EPZ31626.1 hypothetical protein O9G_000105 [Rozella allomycis CSF55]
MISYSCEICGQLRGSNTRSTVSHQISQSQELVLNSAVKVNKRKLNPESRSKLKKVAYKRGSKENPVNEEEGKKTSSTNSPVESSNEDETVEKDVDLRCIYDPMTEDTIVFVSTDSNNYESLVCVEEKS